MVSCVAFEEMETIDRVPLIHRAMATGFRMRWYLRSGETNNKPVCLRVSLENHVPVEHVRLNDPHKHSNGVSAEL